MVNRTAAIIITTVAVALFTVFWAYIDREFNDLDARLRCVEQQIAAMSARIGIKNAGLIDPLSQPTGPPARSRLDDLRRAGP